MRFVALEKKRVISIGSDAKNLSVIAGGDVQIPALIERQAPYVFRAGIKKNRRLPSIRGVTSLGLAPDHALCLWGDGRPARSSRRSRHAALDLINLPIRIRSRVNRSILSDDQSLHLQLLRLKNRLRLAPRHDPINAGWPASCGVNLAMLTNRSRPNGARWRGCDQFESRRQLQESITRNGDPVGGAFQEIRVVRLFPAAGAFRKTRRWRRKKGSGIVRNYEARWWPLKEREIVELRVSRRALGLSVRPAPSLAERLQV